MSFNVRETRIVTMNQRCPLPLLHRRRGLGRGGHWNLDPSSTVDGKDGL
jgi:hypothetical protein